MKMLYQKRKNLTEEARSGFYKRKVPFFNKETCVSSKRQSIHKASTRLNTKYLNQSEQCELILPPLQKKVPSHYL